MYNNLKAEMARYNISIEDLAKVIGVSVSGIYYRLSSENKLKLFECKKIRNELFPDMKLDYLFADDCDSKHSKSA